MFKNDPDKSIETLADGGVAVLASEGIVVGCVEVAEAGASDANASKPLDEKSDNRGYGNVSVGVEDEDGVGVDTAPSALSNEEAARILASSNSGIKPNLARRGYRSAKRAFDLVASGTAIALLLVPGAVLAAVICIKSPGASPLYSQLRVGRLKKDGSYKLFRMHKFRSMVPDADRLLDGLQDRNEADGPLFKIKDDPRVIPGVGQFIRKHSIDELPQLINVLIGDMSLIGPRPALPCEVVQYGERAKRRLTVKCGCGGAWQAGSRSDSSFAEMVALDL